MFCTGDCVPLLIQQNDGTSDFFNRSWAEFKVGFGDPSGNYWLGNDLLSQLTASAGRYKLQFDLQSRSNGNWYRAVYSEFTVLTEADNYRLHVAGYSDNVGGDVLNQHGGTMFTTYDRDNDPWPGNCAQARGGGFWYSVCGGCAVNGQTQRNQFRWNGLPGGSDYLQSSRMSLQCR